MKISDKPADSKATNHSASEKKSLLKIGIRNKLVVLLLGFGLVPALVMFGMLIIEEDAIRKDLDARVEATAAQINDVIDRNLFERYGDVQAFGLNRAAQDQANWANLSADNPLARA